VGEEPEQNREGGAKNKTGDDGEIKGRVFATMNDVAGKFSQPEGEFATEVEKSAREDEEATEEKERKAEFAERMHEKDSRRSKK
jgi:hypothetical protein